MKSIYSLCICAIVLLFSCSSDDSTTHPIQQRWELETVTRGLAESISYNNGLVFWTFTETELIVENNILTLGPEQVNSGFETGNYSYEIKQENGVDKLYINNEEEGIVIINSNQLIIDYGTPTDGPAKFFKR